MMRLLSVAAVGLTGVSALSLQQPVKTAALPAGVPTSQSKANSKNIKLIKKNNNKKADIFGANNKNNMNIPMRKSLHKIETLVRKTIAGAALNPVEWAAYSAKIFLEYTVLLDFLIPVWFFTFLGPWWLIGNYFDKDTWTADKWEYNYPFVEGSDDKKKYAMEVGSSYGGQIWSDQIKSVWGKLDDGVFDATEILYWSVTGVVLLAIVTNNLQALTPSLVLPGFMKSSSSSFMDFLAYGSQYYLNKKILGSIVIPAWFFGALGIWWTIGYYFGDGDWTADAWKYGNPFFKDTGADELSWGASLGGHRWSEHISGIYDTLYKTSLDVEQVTWWSMTAVVFLAVVTNNLQDLQWNLFLPASWYE